ncbi:MAG: TolC family protein [Magnetococcus sp. MYC-9]
MRRWWVVWFLLLGGCLRVGEEWQPPALEMQGAWSLLIAPEESTTEADFWLSWGDERLLDWVQRARIDNRDIRLAAARITEARALTRLAAADALPSLELDASLVRDRISDNNRVPPRGMANPVTVPQLWFDARWELDLFGRLQRQQEAAEADLLAAHLTQAALQISLSAEVAATYFEWRAASVKVAALHRQADASRALLVLVRSRVRAGLNTELDLRRAEDQAAQIDARLPAAQTTVDIAVRRLGILTGGQADSLLAESVVEESLPARVPALPHLLPAELLDRRPDLRAAEARAHAAFARIGVAEGESWPHLSLAAILGTLPTGVGNLLSVGSAFYTVGPQLNWPLYRGEALTAQVDVARARTVQETLTWEKTAVEAVMEVETAALRHREAQERLEALSNALTAQQHTLELATLRYQRGMSDFSAPLEVARQLAAMEIEVVETRLQLLTSGIALYKALGGGWQPP